MHRPETFAAYLARHYIERRQFTRSSTPETAPLHRACDFVLTRQQGPRLAIVCIVDLQAHPHGAVELTWQTLAEVGELCRRASNGAAASIVTFELLEIGVEAPTRADCERLRNLSRQLTLANASLIAWRLDTVAGTAWISTRAAGLIFGRYGMERLMSRAHERLPIVTLSLLLVCALVFAYEVSAGVAPWSRSFAPNVSVLTSLGALERSLVAQQGEWYRVLSAAFLHVNMLHLLFNGLCLYLSGTLLERLIGHCWLLALFIVGVVGGNFLSLALNPIGVVSVGASGGIMGLLALASVCSFRYARGSALRRRLQTISLSLLLPSLIPFGSTLGGLRIDMAGHVGGALSGTLVGLVMLKTWPLHDHRPTFRSAAAAVCIAGTLTLAGWLAVTWWQLG
jgi:rhomboid protease GluP